MLFDLSPTDPVTFVGAMLILGATTVLASLVPAWRATSVDH